MPTTPKVVLVTGCTTGIGRALARELVAVGHRTFASARDAARIPELAVDGAEAVQLDVNDVASIRAAVETVVARAGRIDVLINNAGINLFAPVMEAPLDEIRAIFDTNLTGLIAVSQAVFPHMAERRSGRIVNIGSVAGLLPTPWAASYCASKSAVHMLSEVMRMEVRPFGIDVVTVQPGAVQSNIAAAGARGIDRYRAETSRYRAAVEGIVKRAYSSQDDPMATDVFARELIARSFADPAPRIVRLGNRADAVAKMAEADPELRDANMVRAFAVDKLPG